LLETFFCHGPVYGERKFFTPTKEEDFGDGGAYPEVHLIQYPRQMADPRVINGSRNCLPISVNINGDIHYHLLLNSNKDKITTNASADNSNNAMLPHIVIKSKFDLEVKETQTILQNRINDITKTGKSINYQSPAPYFITYTPKNLNFPRNNRARERLLQIQEIMPDPMEPPKHKIKKIYRPLRKEPVPVMHSPPNGVDYREAMNWKIPPALSNWKNSKGYIIPLDKRLAVDGRALQETKINDNFAKLSEALYIAERKAREETELRNWVAKENLIRQKERKNAEIRAFALNERLEESNKKKTFSHLSENRDRHEIVNEKSSRLVTCDIRNIPKDRKQYKVRSDIRKHNRHLRERERRMLDAGEHGYRRSKITRDSDRDISERLALGMIKYLF